jgi:hypothetical protein
MKVFGWVLLIGLGCSAERSKIDGSCVIDAGRSNFAFPEPQGPNVLPIRVGSGGGTCEVHGYFNEPCVSVTVCTPGTEQCQVVTDLLLDTGSMGLRIFKSVLQIQPEPILTRSGAELAQCAMFGTGSDWGTVERVDVKLGGMPTIEGLPIQVIDAEYASSPSSCGTPDVSPEQAGYNGILGVGLLAYDCGTVCAVDRSNGMYYGCSGTECVGASAPFSAQVENPIHALSEHNNGLVVQMQPMEECQGSETLSGYLIFGIGTLPNNEPTGEETFSSNLSAHVETELAGRMYRSSFLDTGSNGLFFPGQDFSWGQHRGFFSMEENSKVSAVMRGLERSAKSRTISFSLHDAKELFKLKKSVYVNLGGPFGRGFDWGFPFYIGRRVFSGIEDRSSILGDGPFWAF